MDPSSTNSSTNITEDRSEEESPKYWHETIPSAMPQNELNASIVHSHLKVPVHLEIVAKRSCPMILADINTRVKELLTSQYLVFQNGSLPIPSPLASVVESISVVDLLFNQKVSFWQAEVQVHSFRMMDDEPEAEYLEGEHGDLPLGEQLELPNTHLQGLWESIVVDSSTKNMLLNYCSTSLLFAGNNVDSNVISWNKMILLHGPPGTGKTSLCKALAQKICIRNAHLFQSGLLFEVNCHSLFSKWFSESGKLVMKLFQHISDIADDEECLVVLLIDEVESIAAARNSANRSGEPGDAIRVVNAVLTSLDQLRRRKNVLVMCTSNMQSTLDEAFLDRLDLNIYVGNPSMAARQEIIATCIGELINRGLLFDNISVNNHHGQHGDEHTYDQLRIQRQHLLHLIAEKSEGYSGRALRKLPIKTFAKVVNHSQVSVDLFLQEMLNTVAHSNE